MMYIHLFCFTKHEENFRNAQHFQGLRNAKILEALGGAALRLQYEINVFFDQLIKFRASQKI